MKKFLFALLLLVSTTSSKAQTVNGIPLQELDVEYILIRGMAKLFSKQVQVEIDFGQRKKMFTTGKETFIKDDQGRNVIFNSMIDALNYMSEYGYGFVNAYVITAGNQNVYHYLLRNRKYTD